MSEIRKFTLALSWKNLRFYQRPQVLITPPIAQWKLSVLLTALFFYSLFTKTFLLIEFKTILQIYENIRYYFNIRKYIYDSKIHVHIRYTKFLPRLQPYSGLLIKEHKSVVCMNEAVYRFIDKVTAIHEIFFR